MTPRENFGASDIIQRLLPEGESHCHLKALQMYLQLAWEQMQKGKNDRRKASLLGVGQEEYGVLAETQEAGQRQKESRDSPGSPVARC